VFIKNKITESERLLIRELTLRDTKAIFQLYSDKEAMKYRGSKPLENLEEAELMILNVYENIKNKREFRYAIINKISDEVIGTFLITPLSNSDCRIGCSIGKEHWRKGYGIEVMSIMEEYLKSLKYKKLIGFIKMENIPSIKLFEKLNYKCAAQAEYPEFFKYEIEIN
jgi:ribosomal-protein-alanine N-acetyltransferase